MDNQETELIEDKVVEGVRVFVHRYKPTDEDRARWDAWWREFLGRRLNTKE
jgi:hypothetical protein